MQRWAARQLSEHPLQVMDLPTTTAVTSASNMCVVSFPGHGQKHARHGETQQYEHLHSTNMQTRVTCSGGVFLRDPSTRYDAAFALLC